MPDPVLRSWLSLETGGDEETYGGSGGVVQNRAAGPGSPRPEEEYTILLRWKEGIVTQPYAPGTSDWITVHAYVRFTNDNPGPTSAFLRARNLVPNECWYLRWHTTTAGRVTFVDSNGASQGSTGGWKTYTWYHIVVKFKWVGSSDVLVVRHELRANGDVVRSDVMWSLTGVDCLPAGAVNLVVRVRNDKDPLSEPLGAADIHCSSTYVETDSGASITAVNTWNSDLTALCYGNTTQDHTPDFGADNLALTYTWGNAGNLPLNAAFYAWYIVPIGVTKEGGCYTNDGARIGPNNDTRLPAAGVFHGAGFVWRADASSNATLFNGRYGKSFGTPATTSPATTITPGTPQNIVQHIDAASAYMPSPVQYFAQGMKAQSFRGNAGGIQLLEQWSILVVRRRVRRLPGIIRGPGIVAAA